jgi:hypothetical protein
MPFDSIQYQNARKGLINGFVEELRRRIQLDPDLKIDGQIGVTWGQVTSDNHTFYYQDFYPGANKLDLMFAPIGVKATPTLSLNPDLVNNNWVNELNQQQQFSNSHLVNYCLELLKRAPISR